MCVCMSVGVWLCVCMYVSESVVVCVYMCLWEYGCLIVSVMRVWLCVYVCL